MTYVTRAGCNFNNHQSILEPVNHEPTTMDNKLKVKSNNVNNNDSIVDLIPRTEDVSEPKPVAALHKCERNVPVLFATLQGVHIRRFNKNSPNNYSISICDIERWVS